MGFGDFAHAAGIEAETCDRANEFGSGDVKPDQADARRPEEHGHQLGPHHADEVVDPLRPSDDGGGLENLAVRVFVRLRARGCLGACSHEVGLGCLISASQAALLLESWLLNVERQGSEAGD
jgi:hypothetical protein